MSVGLFGSALNPKNDKITVEFELSKQFMEVQLK